MFVRVRYSFRFLVVVVVGQSILCIKRVLHLVEPGDGMLDVDILSSLTTSRFVEFMFSLDSRAHPLAYLKSSLLLRTFFLYILN